MKLLIVESPAKARKIGTFLGSGYKVKASVGHVTEIPPRGLNIDVKNGFQPVYAVSQGKKDVVDEIKSLAKQAEVVYLATDPDREGEAIAWHLWNLLPKASQDKCRRVSYDQVTKAAVQSAIEKARDIDQDLVSAQKARQVLDRLIGYKASPLLWFSVGKGTSAGRVQSIALKLIVDRQAEIDAFVPEDYWHVDALLRCSGGEFWARVVTKEKDNRFKAEAEAKKALADVRASKLVLASVEASEKTFKAPAPFDTTSMQTTCSSSMKWNATRTMKAAQSLYENGRITYLRTDSYHIAPEAVEEVRKWISGIGAEYLPDKPNVFEKKSGAAAQEAHECIRPTHLEDEGSGLSGDEKQLYSLVWSRFVACQMTPMVVDAVKYTVKASKGQVLSATGQTVKFDGWSRVWKQRSTSDQSLPKAKEGEELSLKDSNCTKHTTQPPPRYNDGSIIKRMEEDGVGRPSTRASILKSLHDKGYVDTDGGAFVPTQIGKRVCGFLAPAFKDFFMDIRFTAGLEDALDEIASGKKDFLGVVTAVYSKLQDEIKAAKTTKAERPTFGDCPKCGKGKITEKIFKGSVFYSCDNYPECKTTFRKSESGQFAVVERKKAVKTGKKCPECGKDLVQRTSSYGNFVGCSGWPRCKHKE